MIRILLLELCPDSDLWSESDIQHTLLLLYTHLLRHDAGANGQDNKRGGMNSILKDAI